jgi:hypothetical protein
MVGFYRNKDTLSADFSLSFIFLAGTLNARRVIIIRNATFGYIGSPLRNR